VKIRAEMSKVFDQTLSKEHVAKNEALAGSFERAFLILMPALP
jgi:hypothetical protein